MDNLELYNKLSEVPKEAQKTISGGKLNGKTDINPMWRIKMLTSVFGPVGFGWYTEITDRWVEVADGESAAWVVINLYVKNPSTGEWSKPIVGTGGSKQNGKGIGDGINDEAFKMAETDAISVACKKLGMGASVYWGADKTKYTNTASTPQQKTTKKLVLIEEGNDKWGPALDYCVKNGKNAVELLDMGYTMSAQTITTMQAILDSHKRVEF